MQKPVSQVITWYIARGNNPSARTEGPFSTEEIALGLRKGTWRWLDRAIFQGIQTSPWRLLIEHADDFHVLGEILRETAPVVPQNVSEAWTLAEPGSNRITGPYTTEDVATSLREGRIGYRTLAWRHGWTAWRALADCEEFGAATNAHREVARHVTKTTPEPASDSSGHLAEVVRRAPALASRQMRPDEAAGEDLLETPTWMQWLSPQA